VNSKEKHTPIGGQIRMDKEHNIRLTSGELFNLWNTYMSDSLAICVLRYFKEKVQDTQIKPIIESGLALSQKHIQCISEIYKQENHPIPQGFFEEDSDLRGPSLFGDSFYLHYIKQMGRVGIGSYGLALSIAARSDIRKFYKECLHDAIELDDKVTNILLSKGLYIRSPYISLPRKVEFIQKQNFLGDLLGEKRPLLAGEITNLYANIQTNALGKALVTAFSQAAQSKQVREYMVRGRNIAGKHIEVLGGLIHESELKIPMTWNDTVTNSTSSAFSDKLMMFHVGALLAIGIADYGVALSTSMRKDISTLYVRLLAEIAQYAEDGANILIENGWMEQPPQADDRDALAEQK
jgi:spore coat protein CotF